MEKYDRAAYERELEQHAQKAHKLCSCFGGVVQVLGPHSQSGKYGYYWVSDGRNTFVTHEKDLSSLDESVC